MIATDNQKDVGLPEGLRGQFARLRDRLWQIETLAAFCLGLGALLISFLALFVSDRLWNTPVWLRVGLSGAGFLGMAWCALNWVRQWVIQPRDQRALAVLVQSKYRRLGDRLLGIVELADEKKRPAYFSPALYRAAIEQVAAEAKQFDFPAAVNGRAAKRLGYVLLGLALVSLVPVLLSPEAALNVLHRWVLPTAGVGRFTLVSLEGLPREQVVAHGEAFDITGIVRYRSRWRPGRAVGQFERQPKIATLLRDQRLHLRLPGQVQAGILTVRLGDARAQVAIKPTYRPTLKELTATVELPAYLQYPQAKENVETGSLNLLEGSRASFQGRISRPLAAAHLQNIDQAAQPLRTDADRFLTDSMDLDGVAEVAFTWRDQLGLDTAGPWRLQIRPLKDTPPVPELTDLLKDTVILENEVLDIKASARDDFGVRELGLDWQLLTEVAVTNSQPQRHFAFPALTPREKKVEETFHFSPGLLLIPPDSIVELRGSATDFLPGRPTTQTPVYRVHVVGNERHAELVRQNLESLLTHLEEVTRLEEKVAASTKELQELSKQKLDTDEAGERIAAAKEDQTQNAAQLEQLAKEGKKTLREAFRNPTFSEETLRDWAKTLQEMQQLSQEKMQQAAQALKSAQQKAESRPESLAQAAQKEQDILDALEEMQRKVNKGLDQLQAMTLAQRLRKVSSDEKQIAGRLLRIVPETIGMFPKELSPKFRDTEAALADDQQGAQQETQVLQGEIGRFFERTQKENYGEVNKQMTEARVGEELDRVRGLIQENISMDGTQNLQAWSERLNGWADLLEPKSESSGGGGGSGGEGDSSDDALIKELLGLLRVRDRQVNVRQRTALLDRHKPESSAYAEAAKALAASQGKVREDLVAIQGENPVPALEFPLQDIADTMEGIETLLKKPQTNRETDVAQTKSVEQLSDIINLINEQQQRKSSSSSSQSPSAEEMAFLMQMMALQNSPGQGMGLNSKGGGSMAGGTTDRTATPTFGDPNARAGESRIVNRASGSAANAPTEFREALESYFKAIEALDHK